MQSRRGRKRRAEWDPPLPRHKSGKSPHNTKRTNINPQQPFAGCDNNPFFYFVRTERFPLEYPDQSIESLAQTLSCQTLRQNPSAQLSSEKALSSKLRTPSRIAIEVK